MSDRRYRFLSQRFYMMKGLVKEFVSKFKLLSFEMKKKNKDKRLIIQKICREKMRNDQSVQRCVFGCWNSFYQF